MELRIVDATGNKSAAVSVPGDVPSGRIALKMVQVLGLPRQGNDGMPLSYKFHHKQSGRQLADGQTLLQAGVADNDVLRLVAEITAG